MAEPRTFKLGGRIWLAFQVVSFAAFVNIGLAVYRVLQGQAPARWGALGFAVVLAMLFQYITLGVTGTLVIRDDGVAIRRRLTRAIDWRWSELTPRWAAGRGLGGRPSATWQLWLDGAVGGKRRRIVLTSASVEKPAEVRALFEARLPKQAA